MHSERKSFFEDYSKAKDELSPVERWSRGGSFPYRLVVCILIIILTSSQVYFITTRTIDHSRQFVRALNYYILDHTGFDFYWAGSFNFNYPIQEYFTLQTFNDMMGTMWSYMGSFSDNVYGKVDQQLLNSSDMNLTIAYSNGSVLQYMWTISQGIQQPFQVDNISSIKQTVNQMQYMEINMQHIPIGQKEWSVRLLVENYSQASLIVTLISDQTLSLWKEHIGNLIASAMMVAVLLIGRNDRLPYLEFLLFAILFTSSVLSFMDININTQLILDGVACLLSWFWLLEVIPQRGIYHVSMLLGKSYLLVGRLFISFLPLFIGFAVLAYCLFCRYAHQFSSFKQTLLSLFYICYYNMTYEEIIVTARADPISSIFFFVFVLLFTFCIYSSMLVSVFCSFAWDRREQEMQKDILNNLKIKCSNCDFIYKYDEKLVINNTRVSRASLNIDAADQEKKKKLRQLYRFKIENAHRKIDLLITELKLLEEQLTTRDKIQKYRIILANVLKEKYNIVRTQQTKIQVP